MSELSAIEGSVGLLDRLFSADALAKAVAKVESAIGAADTGPTLNAGLLSGLHGGAPSFVLAAWYRHQRRPALIVNPDRESASQLADDLETWLGPDEVVYLPQQEVLAFDRKSPDPAVVSAFLAGLARLGTGKPCLAVTSLYGLRQRVISRERLATAIIELQKGQRIDLERLCEQLAERGYRPAGMVTRPGDYAQRGGLLDVYAPGEAPLRIEFFADEIVSLRAFDIETQRSCDRFDSVAILPVSHLILDDDALLTALSRLENAYLQGEIDQDEHDDLAERLQERLQGEGLEAYLPYFAPTELLTDHLPEAAVLFWLHPVELGIQSEVLDSELPHLRRTRLKRDALLPAIEELVAGQADLAQVQHPQVFLAASWITGDTSGHWLGKEPRGEVPCQTSHPLLKGGDIALLRKELTRWEEAGDTVLLLCDNRGQADRWTDLLEEIEAEPPLTQPLVGSLSQGFMWPELKLACLTDHEFFERYHRPVRIRHRTATVVKDQRALKTGEYVVHLDYGIGRYQGLRRINVEHTERECLLIEYAEGGKVYVPVENIDQIERYSSDSEVQPVLSRLGSASWHRVTKRARKAIRAMAVELLELYAARQALKGYAFAQDSAMQRALTDSFLYEETPDQLSSIAEIKRDMETSRPMDRLVCGDVGYGKTEVAIRAAFKAVSSGKQVALLCPTTLLANQHGETFAERFRDFPVAVETLSRFRSTKEQKEITARVNTGKVDILIGTHRLLSRDVRFGDLGLLIVDEEHRFGVRHKERIKEMRRLVDVLTLSATPIPRTLYLALMGARDMSLINTPPRDRLPIHTELCTFDAEILTEAILREMHRGGQVFYVHNRIETIEATAAMLQDLLPHVRIAVAHGRMKETRLEGVMTAFLSHEFDVLVTTAIIESGLDMPRVNTIIIDRADRFGLAQLYQLRGRVGRSSHRAFAYLMTPPGEKLTLEARRRLAALEEFQALGSGYHIAMRDLEIRGAGNLLGAEQHGHMEAIGFELYCRLLEETVAELRGGSGVAPLDIKVDLRLPAYFPDDYLGDAGQKMDFYRRLARLREPEACDQLADEVRDRFGPLPSPVANLVAIHRLRLVAGRCGVEEIKLGRNGLDFFFTGEEAPSAPIIRGLMEAGPQGLQFKAVDQFIMRIPAAREQALAAAASSLSILDSLRRQHGEDQPPGSAGGRIC